MLPDAQSIRRVALTALALTTLTLGACANSPLLMPFPSGHPHPVKTQPAAPPPNPGQLNEDLAALHQWFEAPADAQNAQLEAAEADYQRTQAPREKLRLALLLAVPGTPSTDLPRAQQLLKSLSQDPSQDLLPAERTLAQLALSLVAHQLTQSAESRTLQTGTVAKIAKLQAQLDAVTDQDVALRRQLEQARAKLAAIANIEKSLNEGKLGTPGPP